MRKSSNHEFPCNINPFTFNTLPHFIEIERSHVITRMFKCQVDGKIFDFYMFRISNKLRSEGSEREEKKDHS